MAICSKEIARHLVSAKQKFEGVEHRFMDGHGVSVRHMKGFVEYQACDGV